MQEHSHTDISNFLGLDQRRNGTENSHLQPEWETGSCRWRHDAHFQLKRTSRIPWMWCFGTMRFEKRKKRTFVFTFLWWRLNSRIGSSHNHIRQSAHDPRISNGHARRFGLKNLWLFRKYMEIWCSEQFTDYCDANRIVDNERNASD